MIAEDVTTRATPSDVVIVEDEPISRRALTSLVRRCGLRAASYGSAEAALSDLARTGLPAIVLVDLHLPGMSGIEFIGRLERSSDCVFPVLITAAGRDVVTAARRTRPLAYFRKPLDFPRLMSLLAGRHVRN